MHAHHWKNAKARSVQAETRQWLWRAALAAQLLLPGCWCGVCSCDGAPECPVIVIDDLNDWVGYLGGNAQARTPNIDRLASRGMAFRSAYAAAPECNPSRAAVMSGLRPFESGVYSNMQDWTHALAADSTLTSQFMAAGYEVFGAGHILYGDVFRAPEWTEHYVPEESPLVPDATARDDGVEVSSSSPWQTSHRKWWITGP